MKTSVISEGFRNEFLNDLKSPNAFECKIRVFDGPEDYHNRLDDGVGETAGRKTVLVMPVTGSIGYPGAPESVGEIAVN